VIDLSKSPSVMRRPVKPEIASISAFGILARRNEVVAAFQSTVAFSVCWIDDPADV
jgi:hypothetical protein